MPSVTATCSAKASRRAASRLITPPRQPGSPEGAARARSTSSIVASSCARCLRASSSMLVLVSVDGNPTAHLPRSWPGGSRNRPALPTMVRRRGPAVHSPTQFAASSASSEVCPGRDQPSPLRQTTSLSVNLLGLSALPFEVPKSVRLTDEPGLIEELRNQSLAVSRLPSCVHVPPTPPLNDMLSGRSNTSLQPLISSVPVFVTFTFALNPIR